MLPFFPDMIVIGLIGILLIIYFGGNNE